MRLSVSLVWRRRKLCDRRELIELGVALVAMTLIIAE